MRDQVLWYLLTAATVLLALGPAVPRAAELVRLHGAASVVENLVGPHKTAVEAATGLSLVVEKSNAGKGLKDLIEGKCDAALASASIEATVAAARSAGLDRPIPDLRMHVVRTSEVVFVVHPSNPVKALTWEQLKDIHTGKIANWKELGGKDQPIAVYTDAAASATRGLVQQSVLAGSAYAPSAKAVEFVKQVNDEVARDERGIGALGLEFVDRAAVAVVQAKKLERPLALVTVGEPSEKVRKVIEAYRAVK
jgi:phosphate transport system substrate-binding protein